MSEKLMWQDNKVVKSIEHKDVRCYIEHGCNVMSYSAYTKDETKDGCHYEKTYVLSSGCCDGEHMDLFDLQKWFDENREWINGLKTSLEESDVGQGN